MPQLVGVLAVNDQLQRATKLDFAGKLVGAEAFAIDKNGKRFCYVTMCCLADVECGEGCVFIKI